jgi:hypothetical protein
MYKKYVNTRVYTKEWIFEYPLTRYIHIHTYIDVRNIDRVANNSNNKEGRIMVGEKKRKTLEGRR